MPTQFWYKILICSLPYLVGEVSQTRRQQTGFWHAATIVCLIHLWVHMHTHIHRSMILIVSSLHTGQRGKQGTDLHEASLRSCTLQDSINYKTHSVSKTLHTSIPSHAMCSCSVSIVLFVLPQGFIVKLDNWKPCEHMSILCLLHAPVIHLRVSVSLSIKWSYYLLLS